MRTAILDVGSNSAHIKIVDLEAGAPIRTVTSAKRPTRLAEATTADGRVTEEAVGRVASAVAAARRVADAAGATEMIAFATSAIRDAANRRDIVAAVADRSGVTLEFLSGHDEARLTFLAARAWYGWSAGPLLLADIGGGSLEIAAGDGVDPAVALSIPLGAGRLTREHLPGDPPSGERVAWLQRHVADELAAGLPERLTGGGVGRRGGKTGHARPVRAVATSKTFTQLARLTRGQTGDGRLVLHHPALRRQIPRLAGLKAGKRAKLKGVSASRARQVLAGAVVAEAVMSVLGLSCVEICPWALREGIALRRLDWLSAAPSRGTDIDHLLRSLPTRSVRTHPASQGAAWAGRAVGDGGAYEVACERAVTGRGRRGRLRGSG